MTLILKKQRNIHFKFISILFDFDTNRHRNMCFDNFAGLDGLFTQFFSSWAGFIAFIFDLLKFFPLQIAKKLFQEVKVNPYILKLQSFHKQSKTSRVDAFRWVLHTHKHTYVRYLCVCVLIFERGNISFQGNEVLLFLNDSDV